MTSFSDKLEEVLSKYMAASMNNKDAVTVASIENDEWLRHELLAPLIEAKAEAKDQIIKLVLDEVIEDDEPEFDDAPDSPYRAHRNSLRAYMRKKLGGDS